MVGLVLPLFELFLWSPVFSGRSPFAFVSFGRCSIMSVHDRLPTFPCVILAGRASGRGLCGGFGCGVDCIIRIV